MGEQQWLTVQQELRIQRLICQNRPEQFKLFKLTFALWTAGRGDVAGQAGVWH